MEIWLHFVFTSLHHELFGAQMALIHTGKASSPWYCDSPESENHCSNFQCTLTFIKFSASPPLFILHSAVLDFSVHGFSSASFSVAAVTAAWCVSEMRYLKWGPSNTGNCISLLCFRMVGFVCYRFQRLYSDIFIPQFTLRKSLSSDKGLTTKM